MVHWHQCPSPLAAMNCVTVWWTGLIVSDAWISSPLLVDHLLPLSSNPFSHQLVHSAQEFTDITRLPRGLSGGGGKKEDIG